MKASSSTSASANHDHTAHTTNANHHLIYKPLDENIFLLTPFLTPDYGEEFPPLTLAELRLLDAFNSIVDKEGFASKLAHKDIRAKWHSELAEAKLPHDQIEYLFNWLDDTAHNSPYSAGPLGVFGSDSLINSRLRYKLTQQVTALEKSQAATPDWHPGSNDQVLDHVHPSLYPLVAGKQVESLPKVEPFKLRTYNNQLQFRNAGRDFISTKYQWLPAEFLVDAAGHVKIVSSINNLQLRSQHSDLYNTIAEVFQVCLPLLENTLGSMSILIQRTPIFDNTNVWPEGFGPYEMDNDDREDHFIEPLILTPYIPMHARVNPPPHSPNSSWKPEILADTNQITAINLKGSSLQVIVKLATIHLTPDKPEYNGGVWHVEGMANERIAASIIYYFDQDNISESRLAFRRAVSEPPYEQGDELGVRLGYGLGDEEALVQPNGYVTCRDGRVIAFPNALQHQVQPFRLTDPTKPARRRILVFFIVDPTGPRIISTADVHTVSRALYADFLLMCLPRRISREIAMLIASFISATMDLTEAREVRARLMEERGMASIENNQQVFQREFSLCEH